MSTVVAAPSLAQEGGEVEAELLASLLLQV
jgi:hypothetical protein